VQYQAGEMVVAFAAPASVKGIPCLIVTFKSIHTYKDVVYRLDTTWDLAKLKKLLEALDLDTDAIYDVGELAKLLMRTGDAN